MKNRMIYLSLPALLAVLPLSCGDRNGGPEPQPTVAVFSPESESFFDVPFPNELRRRDDGSLDLSLFPNPRGTPWVRDLIEAVEESIHGFGPNCAVTFRFSAPIDTSTLPLTPQLSRSLSSSVLLVNVDEESPRFGETVPFSTFYREAEGYMWLSDTLVLLPAQGFVLDGDTLYAAVVTSALRDAAGERIERDDGFIALIDDERDDGPLFSPMEELYRGALDDLDGLGVPRDDVTVMTVFRTLDAVDEMQRVARMIYDEVDDPLVEDMSVTDETDRYWLFEGHYGPNPVFQVGWDTGLFPYEEEGGSFVFDESGRPVLFGNETMTFALSVPKTPMPVPSGFPVLLYAHGTGGDYKTFVRNDTAELMAEYGIAVLGIDNSMNGTRIPEGASPEMLFFNVVNVRAGRDNNRQAAADVIQLERLAASFVIAAEDSPTGDEIVLDGSNMLFMGHSQGGLNGSLYLALSERCRGAYLSGSAGNILYSIAYKTEPVNILAGIGLVLGLSDRDIEAFDIGIYHPLLNLIQLFIEPADPMNYAVHWFADPLEGVPARHILQVEGMGDSYSPPIGIEALGVAAGLVPVEPMLRDVDGFELKGILPVEKPVSLNVTAGTGSVTAGFLQYAPPPDVDGHFVSFYVPEAIETWTWFLHSLAGSDAPEIR
jgi:pimeloyl-ACP methyl ester carboxylesterase